VHLARFAEQFLDLTRRELLRHAKYFGQFRFALEHRSRRLTQCRTFVPRHGQCSMPLDQRSLLASQ
jgi:hypothetical protein